MGHKQDIFKPLTDAQLAAIENENSDQIVLTLSEQQIQEGRQIVTQLRNDEEQFSTLKSNENTEALYRKLNEIQRQIELFKQETLEYAPIKSALQLWLMQLNDQVRKEYAHYSTYLFEKNIIPEFFADGNEFTIGGFKNLNHQIIITNIKGLCELSTEKKEAMITSYTSFVTYLDRISYGWFKRATLVLAKENNCAPNKIRQKTFSFQDWRIYIDILYDINQRDSIIARCLMESTTRISEVLNLTLDQLDWEKNSIRFMQTRKNGIVKEISITYPGFFMKELKEHIELTTNQRKNSQLIFVTRNGKRITRSRLNYSLAEASLQANVKKVTPDSLKKIWTDLIQEGINEKAIMRSKKWSLYEKNFNNVVPEMI